MSKTLLTDEEVIRSYRDAEFRESLTPEQLEYAAHHELQPDDYIAGEIGELSDEDLDAVAGGAGSICCNSCCSFCQGQKLA